MPNGITLSQIHDIGGWTFASIVLGLIVYAFVRGLIVARPIYDEMAHRYEEEMENSKAAFAMVDRLTKAIDVLTSAILRSGVPRA